MQDLQALPSPPARTWRLASRLRTAYRRNRSGCTELCVCGSLRGSLGTANMLQLTAVPLQALRQRLERCHTATARLWAASAMRSRSMAAPMRTADKSERWRYKIPRNAAVPVAATCRELALVFLHRRKTLGLLTLLQRLERHGATAPTPQELLTGAAPAVVVVARDGRAARSPLWFRVTRVVMAWTQELSDVREHTAPIYLARPPADTGPNEGSGPSRTVAAWLQHRRDRRRRSGSRQTHVAKRMVYRC